MVVVVMVVLVQSGVSVGTFGEPKTVLLVPSPDELLRLDGLEVASIILLENVVLPEGDNA
jgi:hypothetical protein